MNHAFTSRGRLAAITATIAAANALAACAPPPVSRPPPVMVVINSLDRAITSLDTRECGGDSSAWRPIDGSYVQPGQNYVVPIARFPNCIDMRARDDGGQIVGAQEQLYLVAGSRWEIR